MPVTPALPRQTLSQDLTYKVTVKFGRPAISEISCFSAVDKGMLTYSLPLTTNITQYYHSFSFVDKRPAPKTSLPVRKRSVDATPPSTRPTPPLSRLNTASAATEAAYPSRVVPFKPDTSSNRRPSRISQSCVPPTPSSPLSLCSSTDAKSYLKPTKASSLKAPPRVNI